MTDGTVFWARSAALHESGESSLFSLIKKFFFILHTCPSSPFILFFCLPTPHSTPNPLLRGVRPPWGINSESSLSTGRHTLIGLFSALHCGCGVACCFKFLLPQLLCSDGLELGILSQISLPLLSCFAMVFYHDSGQRTQDNNAEHWAWEAWLLLGILSQMMGQKRVLLII